MMADFRRTFCPTPEEEAADLELLKRLHREQIGCCSTCVHHVSSNMPGFVTDYGECKVNSSLFYEKVCALSEEPECPDYKEEEIDIL